MIGEARKERNGLPRFCAMSTSPAPVRPLWMSGRSFDDSARTRCGVSVEEIRAEH